MAHGSEPVRVGMIANPVSARDVRRVLSDAAGLTLGERVAMLLRVLRVLASMGVDEVLLMPEREGLRALLDRQLLRESSQAYRRLPTLRWLDMTVSGSVADTLAAASLMRDQGGACPDGDGRRWYASRSRLGMHGMCRSWEFPRVRTTHFRPCGK